MDRLPPVTRMTSESIWISALKAKSLPPPTATVSEASPLPIAAASVETGEVLTLQVVSPASTDSSPVRRPVGTTAVIDLLVQLVTVERLAAEAHRAARAEAVVALDQLRLQPGRAVERRVGDLA